MSERLDRYLFSLSFCALLAFTVIYFLLFYCLLLAAKRFITLSIVRSVRENEGG